MIEDQKYKYIYKKEPPPSEWLLSYSLSNNKELNHSIRIIFLVAEKDPVFN